MTRPRQTYHARQRANAVGIAAVEGVTAAERATGIPKQTIQYWTGKPEFVHLRTTAREVVADAYWVGIQVGIEEVTKGLRAEAPVDKKASALAVFADRHALLTGGATVRTETRSPVDDFDDDHKRRLAEWIDSLPATDPVPEGDPT